MCDCVVCVSVCAGSLPFDIVASGSVGLVVWRGGQWYLSAGVGNLLKIVIY